MSDVISRDWLKTAIHNFYYGLTHATSEADIQAYIDAAPSVTPKMAHWIPIPYELEYETDAKCSLCFEQVVDGINYKYCPNCGARMCKEAQDD